MKEKIKDGIEIFVNALLMGAGFVAGIWVASKIIELF